MSENDPTTPAAPTTRPASITPAPPANDQGQEQGKQSWSSGGASHGPNAIAARNAPVVAVQRPRVETVGDLVPVYGDRAGEHLRIPRGRYNAWMYVVFAFVGQMAMVGGIVGGVVSMLVDGISDSRDASYLAFTIAGAASGVPVAFFTFRDRWRCIEAFSSRFCSGLANLSMLYVPAIALVYANVRAINKLRGH